MPDRLASCAARGFTLVELIVVIGIAALLAAIIGPRFVGRDTFASRGFFDEATETVRYAQKLSVAWRRDVYVCAVANVGLRASLATDCSTPLANPSTGAQLFVPTPAGVNLPTLTFRFIAPTATLAGGQPFRFNPGPVEAAQITIDLTSTVPGDPARRIVVERETGYVHN